MTTITAPVKGFTGDVVGVQFVDGQAETDNPTALAYFRRHGYTVDDAHAAEGGDESPAAPAQSANKAEWVAYAAAHPDESRRLSAEDAEALTKAELVERFDN